jgi:signal transduction histidine kinase
MQIKGSLNTDYREYAHDIHESAVSLQQMIFDILDQSKVEMRRLTLNETKFALEPVIEACVGAAREQALAAGIKLSANIAPNLPLLNGDEHLIKEMLTTLLGNAMTNGEPGDALSVRADVANTGGLFIAVRDTGPGIVAGDTPTPTEPSDAAKPDETADPGVGVSLCRSIVELHGSRFEVINELGGGAMVTAQFPASRSVMPERKPAIEAKPVWSLTARSVV